MVTRPFLHPGGDDSRFIGQLLAVGFDLVRPFAQKVGGKLILGPQQEDRLAVLLASNGGQAAVALVTVTGISGFQHQIIPSLVTCRHISPVSSTSCGLKVAFQVTVFTSNATTSWPPLVTSTITPQKPKY